MRNLRLEGLINNLKIVFTYNADTNKFDAEVPVSLRGEYLVELFLYKGDELISVEDTILIALNFDNFEVKIIKGNKAVNRIIDDYRYNYC